MSQTNIKGHQIDLCRFVDTSDKRTWVGVMGDNYHPDITEISISPQETTTDELISMCDTRALEYRPYFAIHRNLAAIITEELGSEVSAKVFEAIAAYGGLSEISEISI